MVHDYAYPVKDVTSANFGLLIAYVLPGFVLLWGIAPYSKTVQAWMAAPNLLTTSVGGFLYVTLASVALGLLVSTARWLTIDHIHHCTGIRKPEWNFRKLADSVGAFDRLIEDHYRYYQFHANGCLALTIASVMRWSAGGFNLGQALIVLLVNALLLVGSRDTLSKYYRRVEAVLRRKR